MGKLQEEEKDLTDWLGLRLFNDGVWTAEA
jgi:hypothetical protein